LWTLWRMWRKVSRLWVWWL